MIGFSACLKRPACFADGELFFRERFHRVCVAPAAVAHAGEGHGDNVIVVDKVGCDEVPPVGMGAVAMDEQQAGLR